MADDEGVLRNLPKSRPGKRSAKRDSGRKAAAGRPAKAAEKAAARAEAANTPAAKPPRTPRAARTSAKPGRAAAGAASPKGSRTRRTTAPKRRIDNDVEVRPVYGAKPQRGLENAPSDPVSAAVRTAAGIAVTGVRVAGAVTQELLRRLPRP
jgi:hypothetical protein